MSLKTDSGDESPVLSLLALTPSVVAIGGNMSIRFLDVTARALLNDELKGGSLDGTIDRMCLLRDGSFAVGDSSGRLTHWSHAPLKELQGRLPPRPLFSPPGSFSVLMMAGTNLVVAGGKRVIRFPLPGIRVRIHIYVWTASPALRTLAILSVVVLRSMLHCAS